MRQLLLLLLLGAHATAESPATASADLAAAQKAAVQQLKQAHKLAADTANAKVLAEAAKQASAAAGMTQAKMGARAAAEGGQSLVKPAVGGAALPPTPPPMNDRLAALKLPPATATERGQQEAEHAVREEQLERHHSERVRTELAMPATAAQAAANAENLHSTPGTELALFKFNPCSGLEGTDAGKKLGCPNKPAPTYQQSVISNPGGKALDIKVEPKLGLQFQPQPDWAANGPDFKDYAERHQKAAAKAYGDANYLLLLEETAGGGRKPSGGIDNKQNRAKQARGGLRRRWSEPPGQRRRDS